MENNFPAVQFLNEITTSIVVEVFATLAKYALFEGLFKSIPVVENDKSINLKLLAYYKCFYGFAVNVILTNLNAP